MTLQRCTSTPEDTIDDEDGTAKRSIHTTSIQDYWTYKKIYGIKDMMIRYMMNMYIDVYAYIIFIIGYLFMKMSIYREYSQHRRTE